MKQVLLRSAPNGAPVADDFQLVTAAPPALHDGAVLLRTLWLSLDPLIHFALEARLITGRDHVAPGDVVYGSALSRVEASNHPDYAAGDLVEGRTGWREVAAIDPALVRLRKVDPSVAPVSTALGVLGLPGRTAHAGMIEVGKVKAGETVVISAAAGAVGTIAGQIAGIEGARVVGIAGGLEKCAALRGLGFDEAIDYRTDDFAKVLAAACPDGIDVYLENVGGAVMDAVIPLLRFGARIPFCGFIADYAAGTEGHLHSAGVGRGHPQAHASARALALEANEALSVGCTGTATSSRRRSSQASPSRFNRLDGSTRTLPSEWRRTATPSRAAYWARARISSSTDSRVQVASGYNRYYSILRMKINKSLAAIRNGQLPGGTANVRFWDQRPFR